MNLFLFTAILVPLLCFKSLKQISCFKNIMIFYFNHLMAWNDMVCLIPNISSIFFKKTTSKKFVQLEPNQSKHPENNALQGIDDLGINISWNYTLVEREFNKLFIKFGYECQTQIGIAECVFWNSFLVANASLVFIEFFPGIKNDDHVVLYGRSEEMAFNVPLARIWFLFKLFGHEKVSILDGGFKSWTDNKFPVSSEAPTFERSNYVAKLNESLLADFKRHWWLLCNLILYCFHWE